MNSNRGRFEIGGGAAYYFEDGIDTDPNRNMEGLLGLQASYYTYDRPKTTLDASVDYFPGLSEWGRHRLQVNTA